MKPITEYTSICGELTEAQFCKLHPRPFLVHWSETGKSLEPLAATQGLTIDRLILDGPATPESTTPTGIRYVVFEIPNDTVSGRGATLGCSHASDIQINDRSISKVHARLHFDGRGYHLTDADSAAGTQVNGEPADGSEGHPLVTGDRITLGFVDLLFLLPTEFYRLARRLARQ